MTHTRKWAVANWKQFGRQDFLQNWCAALTPPPRVNVVVCPPLSYLRLVRHRLPTAVGVGAQNVSRVGADAAYTGEVSAAMLADCGCGYVIIGHSERRANFNESDVDCAAKLATATAAGLTPILCVGEPLSTRQDGGAVAFVNAQLQAALAEFDFSPKEDAKSKGGALPQLLIAYEPIWAIGSGHTAEPDDIATMHAAIRTQLAELSDASGKNSVTIALLYGGSVNPSNIAVLASVPHVDGVLVGGASLDASQFNLITTALSAQL